MKSEHRHDLKTNELRKLAEQFGPFFQKYGNQLLLGLAAVVLVAGGTVYWMRSSSASEAAGWTEIAKCRTAQSYAEVADNYKNTVVGAWARLNEAESHLQIGLQLSFRDRKAAVSDLKKAKLRFEELLNAKPLPEEARERGLFGMACCLETLSDGDTGEAVAAYEKLVDVFPQSVFAEPAKLRIAGLKTGSSQEFYAWFHAQDPKPDDRPMPKDGPPEKDLLGHLDLDGESGPVMLPEIPYLLQSPETETPESEAPEGKQAPAVPKEKRSEESATEKRSEESATQKKAPSKSEDRTAPEKKSAGDEKSAPAPEREKDSGEAKDAPKPK